MKKITKRIALSIIGLSLVAFSISSCKKNTDVQTTNTDPVPETYSDSVFVPTDWTTATHTKSGAANFGLVFDDNKVQRIDIVVTKKALAANAGKYDYIIWRFWYRITARRRFLCNRKPNVCTCRSVL